MLHAHDESVRAHLLEGGFGLEKESLRIDGGGFLAHTPADFADDVHIVRDFSENQVEVNTPVCATPAEAIQSLEHYNGLVQRAIANLPERELLWPFSNPPYILNEKDIPIAQYFGDDASKTEYREYLSDRYGRYKMAFSGIHLNYSFGEALLRADYEVARAESPDAPATFEAYRDQFYVRLAENCVAYSWILTAVMAASPVMDSSFVEKGKIGGDLFQGLATVRCSELGYWNFFAPILDYTSAKAYADSIQSYIDSGMIRYPSELYYPIRLKNFGPYSLDGLREGISHIELRMVDLNPLVRAGIDERDVLFSQLFLGRLASSGGPHGEGPGAGRAELQERRPLRPEDREDRHARRLRALRGEGGQAHHCRHGGVLRRFRRVGARLPRLPAPQVRGARVPLRVEDPRTVRPGLRSPRPPARPPTPTRVPGRAVTRPCAPTRPVLSCPLADKAAALRQRK